MKSLLILFIFAILGSQCQVHVFPLVEYVVSILHGNARFHCLSTIGLVSDVQWLLNGSVLQGNNLTDVTMLFTPGIGGTLTFMDLLAKYNETTIRCTAGFSGAGDEYVHSIDATKLLIQGLPGEVGSLRVEVSSSNISLSWTAPFSLNISGEDRNIKHYCVKVSEKYANSNSSQRLSCNITETEYNYSLFPSSCYTYQFVVYAVNLVGEGVPSNGSYAKNQTRPEVTNITRLAHTLESEFYIYRITMSTEVCGINVIFMDRDTGAKAPFSDTSLKLGDNFITFTTEQLTRRRHYDIILEVLRNNGAKTRAQTYISTHGIMNVAPTNNNESVEISYYVPSDVSGALLNFVLLNGSSDILSSFIMPLDRNNPPNHTLPFNLHPGHYMIYVYDIGYNGTLYNGVGYPAASTNATFRDPEDAARSQEQSSDIKCTISSLSHVIKAECSDIMATGLQVIAQLINISEIQKLYINQSMDLRTPVIVQVDNDGEYQITIFPISEEMGILDYGVKYEKKVAVTRDSGTISTLGLALVALGLGLGLGLVLIPVLLVNKKWRRVKKTTDEHTDEDEDICVSGDRLHRKTTDENIFVSGDSLHRRSSSCVVPGTLSWQISLTDTPEDTQEAPHLRFKRSHGGHDNQDGDPRARDEQRQEAPFSIQMSEVTGGDVFLPLEPLSKDGQGGHDNQDGDPRARDEQRQEAPFSIQMSEVTGGDVFLPLEPLSKDGQGCHDNQDGDPRDEQRPFSIQMSEVTGAHGDVFLPLEPLSTITSSRW